MLSQEDGDYAVELARHAITRAIGGEVGTLPPIPESFNKRRGVFVTLREYGCLRGCIGFPYPVKPLADAVQEAAVSAATQDPRFPPLRRSELEDVRIEVTVLTTPEPLRCPPEERPDHIIPGRHGIIISSPSGSGLLLPQVATEYGWNSREFLDNTCMKAGLCAGCWLDESVEVSIFEGQIFSEEEDTP
ncbi:MAG: TIGR00296 family protein [Methanoculleaceae archaeon]